MNFDPQAAVLVIMICLISGVSACAWGLMAFPLKISPRASTYYALANSCILIGVILTSYRDSTLSYFHWFGADMLILVGFVMLRRGTQNLFKMKSSLGFDSLLLASTAMFMLLFEPAMSSNTELGIIFSITAAICFTLLARDHYLSLKNNQGTHIVLVPIIFIAAVFAIRAIMLFQSPQSANHLAAISTEDAVPMLWTYILLMMALNIITIGNALTRLVNKIRQQAEKDYLTGLWNRRAVLLHLDRMHQRWLRDGVPYSVILFDVDYFKQINDQHSHEAGDAALIQIANSLTKVIRVTDMLSRYGGEEFLLLLPSTDSKETHIIAEKLQQTLTAAPLYWHGQEIAIRASFGYVTVSNNDSQEQILTLADKAMYLAKSAGRNQIYQAPRSPIAPSEHANNL